MIRSMLVQGRVPRGGWAEPRRSAPANPHDSIRATVRAEHVIFTADGFWLANAPRGLR